VIARVGRTAAVLAAPGIPTELLASWCRDCAGWFQPRVPLPRAPAKENLALVDSPLGRLAAKLESPRGWKRALALARARRPRSLRAFRAGRALLRSGLATPEPLAVLVRRGASRHDALLVTRYVEGQGPWEWLSSGRTAAPLHEALATGLARLHAAGFRHRDLKASNLLLHEPAPGRTEVVWTDLDGLRYVGTLPLFLRARDLARLAMSFESSAARAAGVRAGDWPVLVRAYQAAFTGAEPDPAAVEDLLARTRRWSERAIRRHLAQGRPFG
jgi:tRNA A-37 threonylcarbamoyl transferase component Bud32